MKGVWKILLGASGGVLVGCGYVGYLALTGEHIEAITARKAIGATLLGGALIGAIAANATREVPE